MIVAFLSICLGWAASALAAEAATPPAHPDSKHWDNLFQEDLSDAIFPTGAWHFDQGVLSATKDEDLWTKREYHNCIIDLEFNNDPGANSGLFVYGSDIKKRTLNSVEVQILDDFSPKWSKVPKTWLCGGIFGRLAPAKSVVKKPGQWNRMTVTCRGSTLFVLLNGQQVTEIDMKRWTSGKKNPDGSAIPAWLSRPLAEMPTHGRIGLQGKHGGVACQFRNLKIKPLD